MDRRPQGTVEQIQAGASVEPFTQPLPLVGTVNALPPQADPSVRISIGEASQLDSRLSSLLSAIAAQVEADPNVYLGSLGHHISQLPGVYSVNVLEDADTMRFEIDYRRASDTIARKLDFGSDAASRSIVPTFSANQTVPLQSNLSITTTLGLDRKTGQVFLDRSKIVVQSGVQVVASTPGGPSVPSFDFSIKNGLLEMGVTGASINMSANATLTQTSRLLASQAAGSYENFFERSHTGSLAMNMPVQSELLGTTLRTIGLNLPDVFGGNPQVVYGASDGCLAAWSNYTANDLNALVDRVGAMLDAAQKSLTNAIENPILSPGNLLQFRQAWDTITSQVRGVGGELAFETIQGFLAKLEGEFFTFDANTCSAMFKVDYKKSLTPVDTPVKFGNDMGYLNKVSSDSKLTVTTEAGGSFAVGIDLRPLGYNVNITESTLVKDLNGGINPLLQNVGSQDDLKITLSDGHTWSVNFDSLDANTATVGNVFTRLTAGSGTKMTAALAHGKIVLTDLTQSDKNAFSVESLNGSRAGEADIGLGIVGSSTTSASSTNKTRRIYGQGIHGDTLDKHLFIPVGSLDSPKIYANLDVSGKDLSALANFGFAAVGIQNATLDAKAAFEIKLKDPGTGPNNDSRISAREFLEGAVRKPGTDGAIVDEIKKSGSAKARFPLSASLGSESLVAMENGQVPAYRLEMDDIFKPTEVKHGFEGDLTGLVQFAFLKIDAISTMIDRGLEEAENQARSAIFETPIVAGITLGEFFQLKENLKELREKFSKVKNESIQDIAGSLNKIAKEIFDGERFPGEGEGEEREYFTLRRDGNAIKLHMILPDSFTHSTKLTLDLSKAGIPGFETLVAGKGSSDVTLKAAYSFTLDIGLDVSTPANPRMFFYDTTSAAIAFSATANHIAFNFSAGPLGVFAHDGFLRLDADGNGPSTAPATVTFGFTDSNGDGRIYVDEDLLAAATVNTVGSLYASLPVDFPTLGTPLDPAKPAIIFAVGDFDDPITTTSLVMPDVTTAIQRIDLANDMSGLTNNIEGFFTLLDTAVDAIAFANKLPLIGDKLGEASRFITDVRDKVKDNFAQAGTKSIAFVQQKLYEALGPDGLDLLGVGAPVSAIQVFVDGVSFDPKTGILTKVPNEVLFRFVLNQELLNSELDVGFDVGLPVLGLELEGNVALKVGAEFRVGMGLSRTHGVFLETQQNNELTISVLATTPGLAATGRLGFLNVKASDVDSNDPSKRTQLEGAFAIDLRGGPDNRLTLAEVSSFGVSNAIVATFNGSARINLDLRTTMEGNTAMPSIMANFRLDWDFLNASTLANANSFGNEPVVEFSGIYLDAGDVVNNLIGPVLKNFVEVIQPIAVGLDILTEPIPVISDLVGDSFSLLRSIKLAAEVFVGPRTLDTAEAVIKSIDKVFDVLQFVTGQGKVLVPIEDFIVGDFRSLSSLGSAIPKRRDGSPIPILGEFLGNNAVKEALAQVKQVLAIIGGDLIPPIEFPIVENPFSAIGLLIGRDIPLVVWELPESKFYVPKYEGGFIPIPPTGFPLPYGIRTTVETEIRIGVGFDTRGFRQFAKSGDIGDIFNGFYINDNVVDGVDLPEFKIVVESLAGLGAISPPPNLAARYLGADFKFDVGIGGTLKIDGLFDIKDGDNDGKAHWDEIYHNLDRGVGCAFDIQGGIYGKLSAFANIYARAFGLDVTISEWEKVFADVDEDFATTCKADEPEEPVSDPIVPAVLNNGQLVLITSEDSDRFIIEPIANTSRIKVTRTVGNVSVNKEYDGVTSIFANGKGGNDEIRIDPLISIPADLRGGTGNDILQSGSGADKLYGDFGLDTLIGNAGNDYLSGGLDDDILNAGDGDDELQGDDGADELRAGNGNDRIVGGLGNDHMWGDDGNDSLDGGLNNDTLYGGTGDDKVIGGLGSDELYGEDGNDTVYAGADEKGSSRDTINTIVGGTGRDFLFGDLGVDTIYGDNMNGAGEGDDVIAALDGDNIIYAGAGNDMITSGSGRDRIWSGTGVDRVDSGAGNDEVYGEAGDDAIDVGPGDDIADGGLGNDRIYGGLGSDTLRGGDGDDYLQAGEMSVLEASSGESNARHIIEAGDGNNIIFGDFGIDIVTSGSGRDSIFTFGEDDTIASGAGDDLIYAGAGSDVVVGGLGSDTIFAGNNSTGGGSATDRNTIYGDDRTDDKTLAGTPSGQSNADTIYGDVGDDTIYGNTGNEVIYALGGSNVIYAGWGADTIFTGSTTTEGGTAFDINRIFADPDGVQTAPVNSNPSDHGDRVYGSAGNDLVWTGPGADTILSFSGNDEIYAGSENDLVDAGSGNNTVDAGAGHDIVTTGEGSDRVWLGSGNDKATLEGGADWVDGGDGDDAIVLGAGDDYAIGGRGNDNIEGGAGRDIIWGGQFVIPSEDFRRDLPSFFALPTNFPGALWTTADDSNAERGMMRLVPSSLLGRSVEGDLDDGDDRISGGADNDWIWGGGENDLLEGGTGSDYVDGGLGNDSITGNEGEDTLRGGIGNDVLRGGDGIDQLFGDSGIDRLFGDAGDDSGNLLGQRLFGGDGIDYLYAFSYATQIAAIQLERLLIGDELHGGADGDWLYGSIRSDVIYGDAGSETVFADALAGPNYADWEFQSLIGGNDTVYGGSGSDYLFGGGGDDGLWGGFDSDWLEGQNGVDTLYGGSGIDKLILDVNTSYDPIPDGRFEVFNGHFRNEPSRPIADDNATDILVINGTDESDTILLGQQSYTLSSNRPASRLMVSISSPSFSRVYSAEWRSFLDPQDPNGQPLVEQFQVAGFAGNDTIGFLDSNLTIGLPPVVMMPLDVTDLVARSDDWIGVLEGGSGDDTLQGSAARDRIDGARGSDTIYGMAGDDQLWGDGGLGNSNDWDQIYGGAGNDDMIGGQGRNDLFAWTRDPDPTRDFRNLPPDAPTLQFGIFVGQDAQLRDDNGDFNTDGYVDGVSPQQPAYPLEDTGLNRVLGGPRADNLFGGTGLDFLYGNGASSGSDQLFNRRGGLFESLDGELAGDEWKSYTKSTNKVWYYGGSNKNDLIQVDFVTEPGILQGHHLITRSTNNNGTFTFDAQVQLDFGARDDQGNLIWDPTDSFYGAAIVGSVSLPLTITSSPIEFSLSVDGGSNIKVSVPALQSVTSNAFLVALNTALANAGLDQQLTARMSDGKPALLRIDNPGPNASTHVANTNVAARSVLGLVDGQTSTVGFVGSRGLAGLLPPEGDFQSIIVDALDGDDTIIVGPTVTKSVWTDGGRGNDRIEYKSGRPILADLTEKVRNDLIETAYDLDSPTSIGETGIAHQWRSPRTLLGLTLDNPTDNDWYKLSFASVDQIPRVGDSLRITSLADDDGIRLRLYSRPNAQQPPVLLATSRNGRLDWGALVSPLAINTDYYLRVDSNLIPTVYQIAIASSDWAEPNAAPATAYDLTNENTRIQRFAKISGLALSHANDVDWFRIRLDETGVNDSIRLHRLQGDPVALAIFSAENTAGSPLRMVDTNVLDMVELDLTGLVAGEYLIRIAYPPGNAGEVAGFADYELLPLVGASPGSLALDTPLVDTDGNFTANNASVPLNLASQQKVLRRDVLIGNDGNDVLIGGSWEDWLLGGNGNDVMSGGYDRQSQDLAWGGSGNDIYQLVPDRLPLLKSQPRYVNEDQLATSVATQSDRFDGGDGDDQILFLGGDLDSAGRVVPDNVAVRFEPVNRRYELTARVWDTRNQTWIRESSGILRRTTHSFKALESSRSCSMDVVAMMNCWPTRDYLSTPRPILERWVGGSTRRPDLREHRYSW